MLFFDRYFPLIGVIAGLWADKGLNCEYDLSMYNYGLGCPLWQKMQYIRFVLVARDDVD